MMSKFDEWELNKQRHQIVHCSGLRMNIEADGKAATGVVLEKVPENIDRINLATLIREGVEYYGRSNFLGEG